MASLPTSEQTVTPGDDPSTNRKLVEQRNQVLGVATGEQNIVARAAFVHALQVSNPSATATTLYVADGGVGTGSAGGIITIYVPATSSITHALDFEVFTALRVQGTFQAAMTVTAVGR
jgi:hypothetical protein